MKGKLGDSLSLIDCGRTACARDVYRGSLRLLYRYSASSSMNEIMNGHPSPKDPPSLSTSFSHLPILDLSHASDPKLRPALLSQLHSALFNIGFLYIINHGVPTSTIYALTSKLPALFDLPPEVKAGLSKLNSPHFLGYSGFAEETTSGEKDLREQLDFATELPVVWREDGKTGRQGEKENTMVPGEGRDLSTLYWRLRGPNQWPPEDLIPGFQEAYTKSASYTPLKCPSRPIAQIRR